MAENGIAEWRCLRREIWFVQCTLQDSSSWQNLFWRCLGDARRPCPKNDGQQQESSEHSHLPARMGAAAKAEALSRAGRAANHNGPGFIFCFQQKEFLRSVCKSANVGRTTWRGGLRYSLAGTVSETTYDRGPQQLSSATLPKSIHRIEQKVRTKGDGLTLDCESCGEHTCG